MISTQQRSGALNNQKDETPEVIAAREAAGSISAPSSSRDQSPLSGEQRGGGADSSGAVGNAQDAGQRVDGGQQQQIDLEKDRGQASQVTQNTAHHYPDQFQKDVETAYRNAQKIRAEAGDPRAKAQLDLINATVGATEDDIKEMERQSDEGIRRAVADGVITEEEAKKKRFALKNIYKTIKPEEMSLFLIDFGLRAMMAGETMGDLGALGAAGSGALGALQGRRKEAYERQVAEDERGIAAGERAVEDWRHATETVQKNRELAADEAGEGGVKWQSQYLENFYRDLGYSEAEIGRILAGGPDNTELINENIKRISASVEKIKAAENEFTASAGQRKMATIPDESGKLIQKPYADLTEEDIVRAAQWTAEQSIKRAGALRESERREQTLNRVRKESGIGS
jgi:hypothetical protein